MRVLGIESSCDDTAAAVLADDTVLSSVVASQDDVHNKFGGIVPELASRSHIRNIAGVIHKALEQAQVTLDDIDAVAATNGPGLVGSLLIGLSAAKAIAFARRLPFVGVNHIEGHLLSVQLHEPVAFPYLALIVSGGHTSLYWAEELHRYRLLGATRDDAAGEAYDKVAKVLGLGFPGGPVIDKLARTGNPQAIRFPRARLKPYRGEDSRFEFSFSGLKTAVWQYVRDSGMRVPENQSPETAIEPQTLADIAASFQEAVVDMLLDTSMAALGHVAATRFVIAGGVSANSRLRQRAQELADQHGFRLHVPPMRFCTDNAAMIAYAGMQRLQRGERDPLTINASADLQL